MIRTSFTKKKYGFGKDTEITSPNVVELEF